MKNQQQTRTRQPRLQAQATEPLQGVFRTLLPQLQQAVAAAGYSEPTPIQEQSLPPLLAGRDLLGRARTGTGKTAAFVLPLLQQMLVSRDRPRPNYPRALILAPTRELAAQIGESLGRYGRFVPLRHTVIFGGVNQYRQVKALERGVDTLVATPGRLLDLLGQGHVQLGRVEFLVLDEVDRMLDMGFLPDIRRVLAAVPAERQTMFFSATMSPQMRRLAETLVSSPVNIHIRPEEPTLEKIVQRVFFVGKKNKNDLLVTLLRDKRVSRAIVFTQMKHVANRVADKLGAAGISSVAIHGNKSQPARKQALSGFRNGRYRVLVATDVAARGLDVARVSHVINYDLPLEAETYVHRIGRTGRAGAAGDALSFCSAEERALLRSIEKLLGKDVPTELDHPYHSEKAYLSTLPAPGGFGRQSGGGNRPRRTQRSGSFPREDRPPARARRSRRAVRQFR